MPRYVGKLAPGKFIRINGKIAGRINGARNNGKNIMELDIAELDGNVQFPPMMLCAILSKPRRSSDVWKY